jgi:transcription antitermination factor NusG
MINQSSWLLLYTRSGKEMFAAENLANQNIEYYLPMESVWVKKVRTAKPVEKPLFPRYLFARPNEGMLRSISGTRGVSGIVRFGDEPYAVDDSIIIGIQTEILLANEQRQAKGVLPKYGFAVNEMVRIIDDLSPWAGRVGRFKGPAKREDEILIEIEYPNLAKSFVHPFPVGSAMSA